MGATSIARLILKSPKK